MIRQGDETVEIVDSDELKAAVDDRLVAEELGEKTMDVAEAVERALSN